jgi:hypothetical protein
VGSPGLDRVRAILSRFPSRALDNRSLRRSPGPTSGSWRADGAAGAPTALKVLARAADGESVTRPSRQARPRRTLR